MEKWYGYFIIPFIAFMIIVRPSNSTEELIGRIVVWIIASGIGILCWKWYYDYYSKKK